MLDECADGAVSCASKQSTEKLARCDAGDSRDRGRRLTSARPAVTDPSQSIGLEIRQEGSGGARAESPCPRISPGLGRIEGHRSAERGHRRVCDTWLRSLARRHDLARDLECNLNSICWARSYRRSLPGSCSRWQYLFQSTRCSPGAAFTGCSGTHHSPASPFSFASFAAARWLWLTTEGETNVGLPPCAVDSRLAHRSWCAQLRYGDLLSLFAMDPRRPGPCRCGERRARRLRLRR